jgi:hypothetical protein
MTAVRGAIDGRLLIDAELVLMAVRAVVAQW